MTDYPMTDDRAQAPVGPIRDLKAKRRYPRFGRTCPMRYKVIDLDQLPCSGRTVNISGGGLRFRSDLEIGKGKTVALTINLAKARLLAVGRITWTKPSADGGYDNGVQFLLVRQTGKRPLETDSLDTIVRAIENKGISSASRVH